MMRVIRRKMKLIHAMVQNYKILDTKSMRICLKFDCEKEIHILNSEALIDGSIQINILKNREIVELLIIAHRDLIRMLWQEQ